MELNLSSTIIRSMVSKVLAKIIRNKLGCEVDVVINDLQVGTVDGKIKATLNLDAEMKQDDFAKTIRKHFDL